VVFGEAVLFVQFEFSLAARDEDIKS